MNDEVKTKLDSIEDETDETARRMEERVAVTQKLAEVGVPTPDVDLKPFAALLKSDDDLRRVFEVLEGVIWRSFAEDIRRDPFGFTKPTMAEVNRRFKICELWFRRARGDLGYSLEQTLDLMGHALRCELDGTAYDPPVEGKIWTPT